MRFDDPFAGLDRVVFVGKALDRGQQLRGRRDTHGLDEEARTFVELTVREDAGLRFEVEVEAPEV